MVIAASCIPDAELNALLGIEAGIVMAALTPTPVPLVLGYALLLLLLVLLLVLLAALDGPVYEKVAVSTRDRPLCTERGKGCAHKIERRVVDRSGILAK